MSDHEQEMDPRFAAARQAVRDLPVVKADAAFAASLRERFVSGRIAEEAGPDIAPQRPARRSRFQMVTLRLAASLALILALSAALLVANRGPRTRIFAAAGEGELLIDGARVALSDTGAIESALRPGALLEVPADGRLDLQIAGTAVYELTGGTRMTLPTPPGRWFWRESACSLLVGGMRFRSAGKFSGAHWTVNTPEGLVEITGTLLVITVDNMGTCVCVLEGAAEVGLDEADLERVLPGQRKQLTPDGTSFIEPIKPMHRDGALDFDQRVPRAPEP